MFASDVMPCSFSSFLRNSKTSLLSGLLMNEIFEYVLRLMDSKSASFRFPHSCSNAAAILRSSERRYGSAYEPSLEDLEQ